MDWDLCSVSSLSSVHSTFETPPTSPTVTETDFSSPGSFGTGERVNGLNVRSLEGCLPTRDWDLLGIPDASEGRNDVFIDIQRQKNAFFLAIKDIVKPLLGSSDFFEALVEFGVSNDVAAQPFMALESQPVGLRGVLKPYQLEGLSWLVHLRNNGMGGILGDDMGLGKTFQTLALFQYIIENDNSRSHKFLVVCPLSVLDTWTSEITKWTTGLKPITYHGTSEQRAKARRSAKIRNEMISSIFLTSYETFLQDVSWFKRTCVWSYIVLDEGHRIKNSRSKRAQGLEKVQAEYKLILTGTPIQNDLTELWSIIHWLYPEVFAAETAKGFEAAFSLSEGTFDQAFLGYVKEFLKLIMLRRTKESPEVELNLPPKQETILSVPITDFQYSWYWRILTGNHQVSLEDIRSPEKKSSQLHESALALEPFGNTNPTMDAAIWENSGSQHGIGRSRITTNILMELRKCSIHPYLLDDAYPPSYEIGQHIVANSGKFLVLQKLIRQFVTEGKKIIIFSTFERALNLCEDLLEMEKRHLQFRHVRLDGRTTSAWRNLSIHLFNNDPRYMVFLVSIRAGGEGLNLVGASTVVFLDEDWNPQVMRQAESRVHRLGQTRPVSIFRLHSKGTVEEQMYRRLSKKAYLATKVIGDIQSPSTMSSPISAHFPQDIAISLLPSARINQGDEIEMLSSSTLENIIHYCGISNPSIQEISQLDEKVWLEQSEKVRTNIFNGRKVDTSSRSFSIYNETTTAVSKASRRIGKQRIVVIDGYFVKKECLDKSLNEGYSNGILSPTAELPKHQNEVIHQSVSGPHLLTNIRRLMVDRIASSVDKVTLCAAKYAHALFTGNAWN